LNKAINKYLTQYAESEVELLVDFPAKCSFEHVVVIPAYKESDAFVKRFIQSDLSNKNALLVLVINQPTTELNSEMQNALHQSVLSLGEKIWHQEILSLVKVTRCETHILLVDRFSNAIPEKQGVGLARKIGADIALALINKAIIHSNFIYSTDADAHLPDNYFVHSKSVASNVSAATFNFSHVSENQALFTANRLYEEALHYYVAGLEYAQSAYAFFTICSILMINASDYAKVRGFPKRSAGEDFYLLNKLAKLGSIIAHNDVVINIDARTSDRVPFGTGPTVNKILDFEDAELDYHYYHPDSFTLLREYLSAINTLWQNKTKLTDWLANLSSDTQHVLINIGIAEFVEQHKNANQVQFNKQWLVWFDAFKTLKFIHMARELYYPDIPLRQAINLAPFKINF